MKIIKLFSIISLFLLVFSANFSNAYANEEQKSSLLENQKEKLKSKNIEVTQMTKKEISFLEQLQNKNEDMQKFEKQMKKEGFKKIKLEDKNSKLKYLATEANDKNAYGYIANNAYKNEKTKEIVVSETIYDNYNKKITKFIAEKRSMTENKEGKILINKNYVEYKAEKVDKNRPVTYAGFKWNGKAFACSMAGLYACAHYCGVWAIVNPIAGGVCEAVCGTAFAAGCSVG
ncbi:TPA: putative immunity/bacteriocin fusion bifunctional protein [Staphylococcus aureus]